MRVGILGGGQLARMLTLAGVPLGFSFAILNPDGDACTAPLAARIQGAYDDAGTLKRLAENSDVVTYEFENVPQSAVHELSRLVVVYPNAEVLAVSQDRFREKSMFRQLGLDTPAFAAVDSPEALRMAVAGIGLPAVLKTRILGYDGKGQYILRREADIDAAWALLGHMPLIVEQFIAFTREVSVVAVRSVSGDIRFYPITENIHRDGILRISRSRTEDPMQGLAERHARLLLEAFHYVGVLAIEFFQVGEALMVNEMAPRVHNSGHWTIEGAETSQFENHLRAILDLPLGSTQAKGYSGMVNFIGGIPPKASLLALEHVHLHDYGKVWRAGRKQGHATVTVGDEQQLEAILAQVMAFHPG